MSNMRWVTAPLIHGLDGPHTPESRALAEHLGAQDFNLNRGWVLTPADWACPCCGRDKISIARLDGRGFLFGHLVVHHDHMADHVERRFHERAAERQWSGLNRDAKSSAMRMVTLVSAFDDLIVCSDCNEADPIGKREAGAPMREFSFAPNDIRRFIGSAPNRTHEIDGAAAALVWQERRPSFELRMKIVDRIIEISLSGEPWYQPVGWRDRADHIEKAAASRLLMDAFQNIGQSWPDVEEYVKLTVPRPVSGATEQTWRSHQPRRLARPPSDKELAAIAGTSRDWEKVPRTWICPCCGRNKAAIVQPSNQKKAGFVLGSWCVFGNRASDVCVCNECAWTASSVAKEAGVKTDFVSFTDVRDVIEPVQNGAHQIRKSSEVDNVIHRLRERAARQNSPRAFR